MKKRIGFIGLGVMGSRMAARLLSAGYELRVYNRTTGKEDALVRCGARSAQTPKQVAEASEVVITMVTDDHAIRAVTEGELGAFLGARPGTVFIDCSTISVAATRELAKKAELAGCHWLDAPVLGGEPAAEAGELPFVVGGSRTVLEQNAEIFKVLGKEIIWLGESGMGQAAKLVHNLVCGISLVAFSEAISLGDKLGLSRKQALEVLLSGAVRSPLLKAKAAKFESDNFEPTAALALLSKDLILAQNAAETSKLSLPALALTKKLYDLAKAQGLGAQDTSAVFKVLESLAKEKLSLL